MNGTDRKDGEQTEPANADPGRRGFLKKAVYLPPALVALGALTSMPLMAGPPSDGSRFERDKKAPAR